MQSLIMWPEARVVMGILWALAMWPLLSAVAACNRRPQGASGDRSPVDENFKILFEGNPQTYIPGQPYNVSLSCSNNLKFHSFTLMAESESTTIQGYDILGHFEILDTAETRFSRSCENMVESTNTNSKTRIDIVWVAPTNPDSGCILIKAAVLQHRAVWFIDDGFLTKRLCAEEIDEINSQTPVLNTCCACDEAKFELVLERQWTRNTHPKDFPSEGWRTRFSELVGASHAYDYRFWDYGLPASAGLRKLAEHGATQALEEEIKENSQNSGAKNAGIRTIIKAPGVNYRLNAVSSTMATIRVDRVHHLISLVSKVQPSPDWIIGVAGMELCLANCTWLERKVLNLYPWDIGTDAGPSYMSADQPQVPPDVIRRITSTFPSDYRSPFYDGGSAPIKPLATLSITRKKIYEKQCDELEDGIPMECSTHPWNSWSECTTKCGPGTQQRVRQYKDPALAESFSCQLPLSQVQNCAGQQCGSISGSSTTDTDSIENRGNFGPAPECELTPWTAWSPCSKTCGKGFSVRSRNYMNVNARDKCQTGIPLELQERRSCFGDQCGGAIVTTSDDDEDQLSSFRQWDQHNVNFNAPQSFEPSTYPRGEPPVNYNSQRNVQLATPAMYGRTPSVPPSPPPRYGSTNSASYGNLPPLAAPTNYPDSVSNRYDNAAPSLVAYEQQQQQSPQRWPVNRFYNERRPPSAGIAMQPQDTQDNYATANYGTTGFNGDDTNGLKNNNYNVVQEFCFVLPIIQPCGHGNRPEIANYWFYDANARECKIFTTDNCDTNKNKFRSLDACQGDCLRPLQNYESSYGRNGGGAGGGSDTNADQFLAMRRRW